MLINQFRGLLIKIIKLCKPYTMMFKVFSYCLLHQLCFWIVQCSTRIVPLFGLKISYDINLHIRSYLQQMWKCRFCVIWWILLLTSYLQSLRPRIVLQPEVINRIIKLIRSRNGRWTKFLFFQNTKWTKNVNK